MEPTLARQQVAHSRPFVAEDRQGLGFPVRFLGESTAPIHPQQIGKWWLEPLRLDPLTHDPTGTSTTLPPRAKQRLEALLAFGVVPRATVVFHEIPENKQALSPIERITVRLHRWAHQELPVLVSQSADLAFLMRNQA